MIKAISAPSPPGDVTTFIAMAVIQWYSPLIEPLSEGQIPGRD